MIPKLLLVLTLSILALTTTLRAADESKPAGGTRLFELRTYHCHPGRLDALNARFRDHTNTFFKKHGMETIGYWMPTKQPDTLIYILAYPSLEAREKSWKEFQADPDWIKAKADSEKDAPIVAKVDSVFMTPTDYSPMK
jgi:hypothetical protein